MLKTFKDAIVDTFTVRYVDQWNRPQRSLDLDVVMILLLASGIAVLMVAYFDLFVTGSKISARLLSTAAGM
jgi:hypothetical protein